MGELRSLPVRHLSFFPLPSEPCSHLQSAESFSWALHWCLSRWVAKEAVRKPGKLWQPLCSTMGPGSRQAAALPKWLIWLANTMPCPTVGEVTNHEHLSWHLHRTDGSESVRRGVQPAVPPAAEISMLLCPRSPGKQPRTAPEPSVRICQPPPSPILGNW